MSKKVESLKREIKDLPFRGNNSKRKIANVKIQVERVIGNIRQKYSILSATQPIDFVCSNETVTTLDKIVYVSCGLINMCDSVVPFD